MIVAFTGPTKLSREQELVVVRELDVVSDEYGRWRSGCAHGVDSVAARQADLDNRALELFVPNGPHNEELVEQLKHYARIIHCDGDYRTRNTKMIYDPPRADLLIAVLKSDKFYRSGEWMTVNIAKRAGVPIQTILI